jgi:uncharacterized repeat protein (TIGR01451 family)
MNSLRFCRPIVVITMVLTTAAPVSFGSGLAGPTSKPAGSYTVDVVGDAPDASPGDGFCQTSTGTCTLRAAIEESNASPDADAATIYFELDYPATIVLTSALPPISQTMNVEGPGMNNLTVDGIDQYRHFRVLAGAEAHIVGLRLYNGGVTSAHGGSTRNQGILTLDDVMIDDSRTIAHGRGGGIYNVGVLTVTHSVIRDNRSVDGGGGIYNSGSLTLIDSTIAENRATLNGAGGGVYNTDSGTATIVYCTIDGNRAPFGGGLSSTGTGTETTISNSTISENRATSGSGGGVANEGHASLTVINSTIGENLATSDGTYSGLGGGILNWSGTAFLYNTTVSSNTARIGGGIYNIYDTLQGKSTILAHNLDSGGDRDCYNDTGGSIVSQGYNLVNAPGNCIFSGSGDVTGVDPLLSPLADHGGATFTHALLPGSPALDQGSCVSPTLATDQRGRARPVDLPDVANADDGCDVGAYEAQAVELFVSKSVDDDNPQPGHPVLFTIAVTNRGAITATHGRVSDPLPAALQFLGPITLEPPEAGTVGVAPPILASEITMPPGETITVSVPCSVRIEATPGTIITNSAAITASQVITPQVGEVSLLLDKVDTATEITSYLPSPSAPGQAVTVSYTVSAAVGSPTGDVIVNAGVTNCSGTISAGQCTLVLNAAGSYTLTATYEGDDYFDGSVSAGVLHQVSHMVYLPLVLKGH